MPESNVTINFDGLFRFGLDRQNKLCKTEVHTAANGHVMKIKVKSGERMIAREILCPDRLKDLHPLFIFVGAGAGFPPTSPSVTDSGTFDRILDLASELFYKQMRGTKPRMYECSLWLQNGTIGGGDEDKCHRVKQSLFGSLKFVWESRLEFDGFVRGARQVDPEAIKDLPFVFARNVTATIPLNSGQALRMKSGKTGTDLFAPLEFGPAYTIDIEYADIDPPASLVDCPGFAHHSEALDLPAAEPIFGIFKPSRFNDNGISVITNPGCCEAARMGPSANLLDEFTSLQQA